MACGLASIHFSIKARYTEAATILILGAIFDLVDGRLARLTGTSSNFGEQFDSMSDMTSFAMAPALLMHQKYFQGFGRLGIAVTFSYVLFGALRLARFNASLHKVPSTYFQGLPTPCAAMAIIGLVLCFEAHPSLDTVAIVPLDLHFFLRALDGDQYPLLQF